MDYRPKSIIRHTLEFAGLLALSAFLIRLAVRYILEVWPVLLILAAVTVGVIAAVRIWRNRPRW